MADDYAIAKGDYLGTKGKCEREGFSFLPVVFEGHGGGWGTEGRRVLGYLGHVLECGGGWVREGHPARIAQCIAISLQRENARAVLNRLAGTEDREDGERGQEGEGDPGEERDFWEEVNLWGDTLVER